MVKKYGTVVILAAVWSSLFLVMNTLNKLFSPFAVGSIVRFLTLLLLSAALLMLGRFSDLRQSDKTVILKLLGVGVLGYLLDLSSFIGFRYSNAATGTVLLKTDVLMANLLSIVFCKEKFRARDWGLTLMMLLGVCLVLGVNPKNLSFHSYDLYFLLSALFVTLNAFLIRHIQHTYQTPNHVIAYYNNFVTFVLFTLSMLLSGQGADLLAAYESRSLYLLFIIGGVSQSLIYVLYYKSLGVLPVWIVKSILLLIPVFTMLFGFLFLHEKPSASHLIGSAIVLVSAAVLICSHAAPGKEADISS